MLLPIQQVWIQTSGWSNGGDGRQSRCFEQSLDFAQRATSNPKELFRTRRLHWTTNSLETGYMMPRRRDRGNVASRQGRLRVDGVQERREASQFYGKMLVDRDGGVWIDRMT